jgi:hypothetical protein
MRPLTRWLPAVLAIAPLAWLLPLALHLTGVAFQPGSQYTDLAVTHWPNALLISHALRDWHQIPLWNPYILAGTPFAANPLSGLWYPPLWLAAFFPVPLTFNLLLILHGAWAGFGAYRLAREEGLSFPAALAAGLVFGGMPKLVAHVAAGHVSLVLAVAWTGWLLVFAGRAAASRRARDAAAAGLILATIILADPRWALPAAMLGVAYGLWRGGRALLTKRGVGIASMGALFALGLSAALTFPLLEFVRLSSRGSLLAEESRAFSLPPSYLLGLIIPQPGISAEFTVYFGMAALALAVAGLAVRRGQTFWACAFIAAVLMALGSSTPFYPVLVRVIPGLNLLRVPSRFMLAAGFAMAMLAARGVEALSGEWSTRIVKPMRLVAVSFLAAGVVILVAQSTLHLPALLVRAGVMLTLVGAVIALRTMPRLGRAWPTAAALVLVALDLALYDATLLEVRPAATVTERGEAAAAGLARDASLFRVYSPSYSLPQPAATLHRIQLADGVDPLQLESTVARLLAAAGIPDQGYSVTLPPFSGGDPAHDNAGALPSASLLGQMNVAYVLSEFPIAVEGLRAVGRPDESYLYINEQGLPRVWVAGSVDRWDMPLENRQVQMLRYTANIIEIRAEGPGLLVVSEAAYPGWWAQVDDREATLLTAGGWMRAVILGPGIHTVRLTFAPLSVFVGLGITLVSLLAYLGVRRWAA